MGLAFPQEFSRLGAKVVISGRDEKTLAEAAAATRRHLQCGYEPSKGRGIIDSALSSNNLATNALDFAPE